MQQSSQSQFMNPKLCFQIIFKRKYPRMHGCTIARTNLRLSMHQYLAAAHLEGNLVILKDVFLGISMIWFNALIEISQNYE